ncbi:hypothetical protein NDA14_007365 [Ustilago hordei]|nr:hypothetical protein NDA14_007365 [Ustilago hordei]
MERQSFEIVNRTRIVNSGDPSTVAWDLATQSTAEHSRAQQSTATQVWPTFSPSFQPGTLFFSTLEQQYDCKARHLLR